MRGSYLVIDVTDIIPLLISLWENQYYFCNHTRITLIIIKMRLTLILLCGLSLVVADRYTPNSDQQTIVHLFEWKWNDIAVECETFLGPRGFAGVQVSPPSENAVITDPYRPWWERYQPVSYILNTRSGTEAEFADMVARCNAVDVHIYVDLIINHMTGGMEGTGTAGTYFNANTLDYPGVPYSSFDFNGDVCSRGENGDIDSGDYANNPENVRNCRLSGLRDLDQGEEYVREKMMEYINRLLSYGVDGFRVDAAKHMWPGDLEIIFNQMDQTIRNEDAFIFVEVIDPYDSEAIKSSDYEYLARVTEFKYGMMLGESLNGGTQLQYLYNFGEEWGMLDRGRSLVFIDNHDNQRGHGGGSDNIITHKNSKLHKMAVGFMLAYDYGYARLMSSYSFNEDWEGPPANGDGSIISPEFNEEGACTNGWICEHRWRQIYNMVEFRNVAHGAEVTNWWDNDGNQISFCREDRGFFAMNSESYSLQQTLQTCLSAGSYCDVISGSIVNNGDSPSCSGTTIQVQADGTAYIEILTDAEDGIVAIHANSKIN